MCEIDPHRRGRRWGGYLLQVGLRPPAPIRLGRAGAISEHVIPVCPALLWPIFDQGEIRSVALTQDPSNLPGLPIAAVVVVERDDHRALFGEPHDRLGE